MIKRDIKKKHKGHCPKCGAEVDLENDNHCIKCGYRFKKAKKKFPWWIILILILMLIYIIIRVSTNQPIIPGMNSLYGK